MVKKYEGRLVAEGFSFGIVVSRWNSIITERMLEGALDTLIRHGVREEGIDIAFVPGTWEIPVVAQKMAQSGKYQAVICIGCLIRGETPHFDYLAGGVTSSLASIALGTKLPVTYGVITVENLEQGFERAGSKAGNKGAEAAGAAIEMANLMKMLG
jgi:6,7-dimethyl-8-ribityllumazine synthase